MQNGDISNEPIDNSAIYVVWEGMLGLRHRRYTPSLFRWYAATVGPRRALKLFFETNQACVDQLWELWNNAQPIAVVTYLPPNVHQALLSRLRREDVPFSRLIPSTPQEMARRVALDSGCRQIIDPDPKHVGLYGRKGIWLAPESAKLIGRLQ
jgi:hypothetical protein